MSDLYWDVDPASARMYDLALDRFDRVLFAGEGDVYAALDEERPVYDPADDDEYEVHP